jgi:RNA polymerase sigma-70 factor (ECF subfamily)
MGTGDAPPTSPTLLGQLGNRNNQQAWCTFMERYKPLIDRWCRRWGLQPADVDDASACIVAKLVKAMADFQYDPAHKFRGWLKTVADNAVRTFLRDRERKPGSLGSGDTDVQKSLEQVEMPADVEGFTRELDVTLGRDWELGWEVIARVRARVKPHTWQAYWLTAVDELPAKEVAEKLGLSTVQVYVAKKRVGEMLQAQGAKLKKQDCDGSEACS